MVTFARAGTHRSTGRWICTRRDRDWHLRRLRDRAGAFALELDRRLRAAASPVRSLLAHPGFAATNLQSSGPTGPLRLLTMLGRRLVAQDAETGAEPQLYAATAPDVQSGQFFGPGGRREMRGHPTTVRADPAAEDLDTARWLWQHSEELTGVSFPIATP